MLTKPSEEPLVSPAASHRQRFRQYILDHHSPPPSVVPAITLERLDPAEYVRTYVAANCDSIFAFAKVSTSRSLGL